MLERSVITKEQKTSGPAALGAAVVVVDAAAGIVVVAAVAVVDVVAVAAGVATKERKKNC